jgi:ribose/xylose/arabinose/galactoside ABC-type transport system permease subunit
MRRLASDGKAILFESSDMPEVIRLSDRVLVMREGRISATLTPVRSPKPTSPATPFYRSEVPMTKLLSSFRFRDAGTLIGLILISVAFASMSPTFLTTLGLMNVLQQSSINACSALGLTLVIISGGIDLSVGPVAALTAVLGAAMLVAGVPIPLALLWALAVGVLRLRQWLVDLAGCLQPFIVTLGGLSLYRALALIYTGGTPIFGLPDGFRALTNDTVGGVPNPVASWPALPLRHG